MMCKSYIRVVAVLTVMAVALAPAIGFISDDSSAYEATTGEKTKYFKSSEPLGTDDINKLFSTSFKERFAKSTMYALGFEGEDDYAYTDVVIKNMSLELAKSSKIADTGDGGYEGKEVDAARYEMDISFKAERTSAGSYQDLIKTYSDLAPFIQFIRANNKPMVGDIVNVTAHVISIYSNVDTYEYIKTNSGSFIILSETTASYGHADDGLDITESDVEFVSATGDSKTFSVVVSSKGGETSSATSEYICKDLKQATTSTLVYTTTTYLIKVTSEYEVTYDDGKTCGFDMGMEISEDYIAPGETLSIDNADPITGDLNPIPVTYSGEGGTRALFSNLPTPMSETDLTALLNEKGSTEGDYDSAESFAKSMDFGSDSKNNTVIIVAAVAVVAVILIAAAAFFFWKKK